MTAMSGLAADLDLSFASSQPFFEPADNLIHPIGLPQGALPDRRDTPACLYKFSSDSAVSCNVRCELRLPEFRSGRGAGCVSTPLVTMPEAAVHEDDCMVLWQHEVRPSGCAGEMKPEAKAARV